MTITNKVSPFAKDIAKELLLIGSVSFDVNSPFTWVSGIKSPVYCDNRKVNSHVATRKKVVDAFHDLIKSDFPNLEIIAGVATGGIPFGILVADRMDLPFIYVRQAPKEHGLMRQVEGHYKPGNKVVLIEDLISTGGSSLKAVQGLRQEQLDTLGLVSVFTYHFEKAENLFAKENINQCSICDLDTLVDVAVAEGRISSQDKGSILAFRNNPESWAQ